MQSWSICPEDYGWCERREGENPQDYFAYKREYENLKSTFDPVVFDPERWEKFVQFTHTQIMELMTGYGQVVILWLDGGWDAGAYELLEGVGAWMSVNGEAIYGTRALAPYKTGRVCLTHKRADGAVHAIYLADEGETATPAVIEVEVPEAVRVDPPCGDAWVVRVSGVVGE